MIGRGRGWGSGGRGRSGGRMSQRKDPGEKWPNLVDVVLSWSLTDVMNEDLFKDKVKTIPSTFPDLKSYLECYTSPLLEELRAEMSSSLESLSTMPSVRISQIEEKKKKYEISVASDCQVAKPCNHPQCYAPSVGDIIVLSDVKPGHISDITRNGRPYRIAFVTDGGDEDDDSPPAKYAIIASGKIDAADGECQDGKSTSLFAACLLNIVTYIRIWRCLDYEAVRRNQGLIQKMVHYEQVPDTCQKSTDDAGSIDSVEILTPGIKQQKVKGQVHLSQMNQTSRLGRIGPGCGWPEPGRPTWPCWATISNTPYNRDLEPLPHSMHCPEYNWQCTKCDKQ